MQNFLIYLQDKTEQKFYSHLLEGYFTCEVIAVGEWEKALQLISDANIGLAILVNADEKQMVSLTKMGIKIPVLVLSKTANSKTALPANFTIKVSNKTPKQIIDFIHDTLAVEGGKQKAIDFCRVRKNLILELGSVVCDVYLKKDEKTFVQLLKKNEAIIGRSAQIKNAASDFVYVKDSDFPFFLNHLQTQKTTNPIVYQELFHEVANKLGVNELTLGYANTAMASFVSNIKEKKDLKKVWDTFVSRKNFLSEHSFIVAFLCNSMLMHSRWKSPDATLKICLAALFHDVAFKELDLSILELKEPKDWTDISRKRYDELYHHPNDSLKIISEFNNFPSDVIKIISHHHEKYDGSGYPRGLDHSKILPLGCFFNVAHEATAEMFDKEFNAETIQGYLQQKKNLYKEGAFAEAISALEKALS